METIETNNEKFQRPPLLTVLSVLSLITIFFGLLGSVSGLFSGPPSAEVIESNIASFSSNITVLEEAGEFYWAEVMTKIVKLVTYTSANFYMHSLIEIVGYATGLAGVILMLRGKKLGFHLYIIYSLIMVFSIYASAPVSEIPSFYLIMLASVSLIFIFLYSRNLKVLK